MVDLRAGTATRGDVADVVALNEAVFGDASMTAWRAHHIRAHLDRFPEGQHVVRQEGRLVGSSTAMRVPRSAAKRPHTWTSITGGSTLPRHDPEGEVLYGLELVVHPEARGQGVGRLLYDLRKTLVRALGLEALVVGGRIPGYEVAYRAERITAERYVAEVASGKRQDPVLSMQLAVGLEPEGVLENYLWDPASRHHAVRLVWRS
jgi:predicted N-acetyltransferase YhbS